MEDKTIIKSEHYNVKWMFLYALILGTIVFVNLFRLFYHEEISKYGIFAAVFHGISDYFWVSICCALIAPQILVLIIYFWLKSYKLNITDKRAYGFTAFGRRVDLPVDSITAIGLGWLKSIKITTASGRISFLLIKNRDEMYESISKLIVERQNKETKAETVIKQETSNADELKKYKDLLDSGVITQDEFEQKKKQLLGL